MEDGGVVYFFCKGDQPNYHQGDNLMSMYHLPTKVERLYCRLGAQNTCPLKEANQIGRIYLAHHHLSWHHKFLTK